MKSAMYKCFERVTIKNKIGNKRICGEIKCKRELRKKLKQVEKLGIKGGIVHTKIKEELQKQTSKIVEEIENEKIYRIKKRIEAITENKSKSNEIWKVRKQATKQADKQLAIKDEEGNLLTKTEDIQKRYLRYYLELLKPREPDIEAKTIIEEINKTFELQMKVRSCDQENINNPFTKAELAKVTQKLENNKIHIIAKRSVLTYEGFLFSTLF